MKILNEYLDYILNLNLTKFGDMDRVNFRLGAIFIDRVRIACDQNLKRNGDSIVDLVDSLHFKPLDSIDDKTTYLLELINTITNKEHPLLILMFFAADGINSEIYKKFKHFA
jgi:hypothetical protein